MRSKSKAVVCLAGVIFTSALSVFASGVLGDLAHKADAVIVAEVQSGKQNTYSATFTLIVVRTIKGSLLPGDTVNVSWSAGLRSSEDLKGSYGLWFLRHGNAGGWYLLPISQGQVPFMGAYYRLSQTASPATSLVASAQSSSATDMIAAELVTALPYYSDSLQLYNIASALQRTPNSAALQNVYGALRGNSDPELRFIALAGLTSAGDKSALAEIAAGVDLLPALKAGRGIVCDAIRQIRDPDPYTVQSLGRTALSMDSDVQRSAATALMYIHTRESLPFLVQLLDSSDSMTREWAMTGLSRFVDNLPSTSQSNTTNGKALVPLGPAPYRTADTDKYSLSTTALSRARYTEAEYLQFWKSWWATMKDKLTL